MEVYEFGSFAADSVLIQPVDDHDLSLIENEAAAVAAHSDRDFRLIAVKVDRWNRDLSPWQAPAVFGKEDFGGKAADTLDKILSLCTEKSKRYYLGGYSLAGLFALWACYQTAVFSGVAAASPSVWFPRFLDYAKEHPIKTRSVYLSLGDKEEKTRNPVMAQVGDAIRSVYQRLNENGVDCTLEWNEGNHFREPDLRTAKGFVWLLNRI